jgi:release factor glutamine methyltransferase
MESIRSVLVNARNALTKISQTPRLDAELLLMHCLQKPQDFLYHHDHILLTKTQLAQFQSYLKRRLQGEPIAYIRGFKEFFSLHLKVTHDTLIPRPDTELLVEWALNQCPNPETVLNVADLGTGSGAIALALASQRPKWNIIATEFSKKALQVAKQNAKNLSIKNITFHLSQRRQSWCDELPNIPFSIIISNPPYISANDAALCPFVARHEPLHALLADDDGLSDLKKIINKAKKFLMPGGYLALEHGYLQANAIRTLMLQQGYEQIKTHRDLSNHDRLTIGIKHV